MILEKLKNYLWDSRNLGRVNASLTKGAISKAARQFCLSSPETWEFSGFSQNGEDGILDVLRSQLLVSNRYFIEIGSADGVENNTAWLAVVEKYAGLMLDGNSAMVDRANRVVTPFSIGVESRQLFVTKDNASTIRDMALQLGPDVFSLDIDGNDYYIAEALFAAGFKPAIFVVEYNSAYGPEKRLTIPYEEKFSMVNAHPTQLYYGVSIAGWISFFQRQGYRFLTVDRAGVNAFFVDQERFDSSFIDGVASVRFNENLLQYRRFGAGHESQFKLIENMRFQEL